MITFELNNPDSYKAYFAMIAQKNKLLGEGKYLYGDVQVGQSEAGDWRDKKLWAWPSTRGRLNDLRSDNLFLSKDCSVWIGGPCPEKYDDEDTFYNDCEVIAKQVISKMVKDFYDCVLSTQFSSYSIQRSDMKISATNFVGCEIIFTYDDPTGMEYDDNHWN